MKHESRALDQEKGPQYSTEELGELLPAYTFEKFIARGGMGSVYKARHKSLDRAVAIKLLRPEYSKDNEFRTSLEREAKAMARLNHPNLVKIYDFGEIKGRMYIIMEYVEGRSLHDSCDGKALVIEEAAELVAGICRGLHHAHSHHILHRDIKPANILVDASSLPKIVDFGIAEPMGTHYGDSTEIFCTPDYAAPETSYQGCILDAQTDIFSVGILFYELLTGELPSPDSPIPQALLDCPPEYREITARATHPDPSKRFQTAEEFAIAVESLTHGAAETVPARALQLTSTAPPTANFRLHCRTSYLTQSNNTSRPIIGLIAILAGLATLTYLLFAH